MLQIHYVAKWCRSMLFLANGQRYVTLLSLLEVSFSISSCTTAFLNNQWLLIMVDFLRDYRPCFPLSSCTTFPLHTVLVFSVCVWSSSRDSINKANRRHKRYVYVSVCVYMYVIQGVTITSLTSIWHRYVQWLDFVYSIDCDCYSRHTRCHLPRE